MQASKIQMLPSRILLLQEDEIWRIRNQTQAGKLQIQDL
jgi:hypothetical protein